MQNRRANTHGLKPSVDSTTNVLPAESSLRNLSCNGHPIRRNAGYGRPNCVRR